MLVVERPYPLRQLVHIVGAGDKAACGIVEPVGAVGVVACREDRGAVLERHAHHLGSAIGSYSHLVANGGCPEVLG